jgi:hypothetical protein
MGWYYHLYGQEAFAMTPQEEGSASMVLVDSVPNQLTVIYFLDFTPLNTPGNTRNGPRRLTIKRKYWFAIRLAPSDPS